LWATKYKYYSKKAALKIIGEIESWADHSEINIFGVKLQNKKFKGCEHTRGMPS
jgi:hypothetical protein